ncbi:MAG: hypothetical protein WAU58_03480 [Terriglobales bacterium]
MVRTAYSRFAYASQQAAIFQLAWQANLESAKPTGKLTAESSEERLTAAVVTFTLSDFVIGNMRDIMSGKAVDYISPPSGETLDAVVHSFDYSDLGLATTLHMIEPRWRAARLLPAEVQDLKLSDLYELQWHQLLPDAVWERYASFSVTVTFQGKTHGPYKALFIFGHDARGNEVVEPEDSTTDPTGLVSALHEQLFPEALVVTRLRTYPVVSNWLAGNQMSGSSCSGQRPDVCCDLTKLKCGPRSEDVVQGLSKPLPVSASSAEPR